MAARGATGVFKMNKINPAAPAISAPDLRRENLRLKGDLQSLARRFRHDLLSPVGSIQIAAEVLAHLSADDGATITDMAGVVKQSGGEISQLVERVSFLLWASAQPSPAVEIDMAAILTQELRELEENMGLGTARIQLPATWPEVRGVAAWLHVIWANLLTNVIRHGGPAPSIVIAWQADADGFQFSLTDAGPGVPAEKQAMLFTPFERLHAVLTPGLGLSIVERLVALQGGRCGHERPAEGGARFYFTLPSVADRAPDGPPLI